MAGKKNYVPQNDAEFDAFFKNLTQYVAQKAAEWKHIPKEDLDEFTLAYSAWFTAYSVTLKPHAPTQTAEKNRVRKAREKQLREFVNRFLRYRPVTDADRDNMGIPNPDLVRTVHMEPKEEVEFDFKIRGIRQVHVDFKVRGAANKAKPRDYDGAFIIWDILETPPTRPEELNRHVLASKTPHTLKFDETERGKTVYVALCWLNGRSIMGLWSDIKSTIVP
jgi:hypothetical protein